jgi:hypothetical protein
MIRIAAAHFVGKRHAIQFATPVVGCCPSRTGGDRGIHR